MVGSSLRILRAEIAQPAKRVFKMGGGGKYELGLDVICSKRHRLHSCQRVAQILCLAILAERGRQLGERFQGELVRLALFGLLQDHFQPLDRVAQSVGPAAHGDRALERGLQELHRLIVAWGRRRILRLAEGTQPAQFDFALRRERVPHSALVAATPAGRDEVVVPQCS